MNNDTLILQSKPYTDKVIGFAGPTPLEIVLDASGKISRSEAFTQQRHSEIHTDSHRRRLTEGLERTYAPGSTGKESRCSIRSNFYIKGDY